jgi:hypothetical protein
MSIASPRNESAVAAGSGRRQHAMLPADAGANIRFPSDFKSRLLVIVDTEEEFDWTAPFSRDNTKVSTVSAQSVADRIFSEYRIVPTYVVDYPVASQPSGYEPLRDLMRSGRCEIGAQLHSWVTPPHEEEISETNSYANNLPADLERRKIRELTSVIEQNFACKPQVYRAGRYGAGNATQQILEDLGYTVDCSVLPGLRHAIGAPDYSGGIAQPYWLSTNRSILEIPVTVGTVGWARKYKDALYHKIASPAGLRLRMPAVAARIGIVERIRLTPEGNTVEECKRLTRTMYREGGRVFVVSYHSPSLVPGNTPYVRDSNELERFLAWLREYFAFFMTELQGVPSTPSAIRSAALGLDRV